MAVIGWNADVNTKILDSTTISIGDTGFIEDSSSNGFKQRRASSLISPDKYQVTMDFDWLTKDADGRSEFDRFVLWYKYKHQYGSNPFWFESISRFNINGPVIGYDGNPVMCQYKITSAPSFSKSGFCMRCTMTWEEVYGGLIKVDEKKQALDKIEVYQNRVVATYVTDLEMVPAPNNPAIKYSDNTSATSTKDFVVMSVSRVYVSGRVVTYITDTFPANNPLVVCLGDDITKKWIGKVV